MEFFLKYIVIAGKGAIKILLAGLGFAIAELVSHTPCLLLGGRARRRVYPEIILFLVAGLGWAMAEMVLTCLVFLCMALMHSVEFILKYHCSCR